jgi:HK97 family phage major capsid protein
MRHPLNLETRSAGKRSLPTSAPEWVRDEITDKREARPSEDRGVHGGGGLTINEPATYEKGGRSFFADLRAAALGQADALDRLNRHRAEVRDLNSTDTSGGDFVPPAHLLDIWQEAVRGSAPFISTLTARDITGYGDVIRLPQVATGATVAAHQDGGAVSETDPVTATIDANVITVAGQVDLSLQAFERSAPGLDEVIARDLARAYADKVDSLALTGSGSSGEPEGLLNADGGGSVTYTAATPTFAGLLPKIAQAAATIATNRKLPPSCILMHPRRLAFIAKELDSSNRPIAVPELQGPNNAGATLVSEPVAEGVAGYLAGMQIVADANVPTTSGAGTNEDSIVLYRPEDIWFWSTGTPTFRTLFDTLSGNLQVRLQSYGYSAFTAEARPESFAKISGTGLAAWF